MFKLEGNSKITVIFLQQTTENDQIRGKQLFVRDKRGPTVPPIERNGPVQLCADINTHEYIGDYLMILWLFNYFNFEYIE